MKNVKIDFATSSIVVTSAYLKRASKPDSKEFNEFVALRNKLPKYTVSVIPARKREKKNSTANCVAVEEMTHD